MRGQTSTMRELTQIDSLAEHDCAEPLDQSERWNVLEPVSGRWSWLVIFPCCGQVAEEADATEDGLGPAAEADIQRAA
jgi:hypothetical protein